VWRPTVRLTQEDLDRIARLNEVWGQKLTAPEVMREALRIAESASNMVRDTA
jgi:hypothetical protein